ncbi:MAG: hypothetical protein Q7V36_06805, partial [Deltaproteobacteria bacterium]|nr:hypothetical protein [Deltaproteobacteria bacterium]
PMSHYLSPLKPGRGVLLWGGHLRALTAAAAVWGVARPAPVWVVDAANRFDPYQLVREAGTRNLSPQEALTRVRVARAFTSHQLVRLLARIKTGSALLLLQPRLPRAAANQHFGRLLAPVIDYFVEVESREGHREATRRATPAVSALPAGLLWGGRAHAAPSPPQKGDL